MERGLGPAQQVAGGDGAPGPALDVSVVLPCLDEEETVAACVRKAHAAMAGAGLRGEVVVVDNGSRDRSAERARAAGARVVEEPRRGYGSAFLRGLAEARGRYLVLADADDTYDLEQVPAFVARLEQGSDLVMGSRLRGRIEKGAMPWSHRWIGNPLLTGLLNLLFRVRVSDAHCGMRALRREALPRLGLRTAGMEFASEMVIKAGKAGLAVSEVPIVYRVRRGESKLRTLRDGWRHLRFMLLLSPTATLLLPGLLALGAGLAGTLALLRGPVRVAGRPWDVHVMILMATLALLGAQVVTLGLVARSYALVTGLEREDPLLSRLYSLFSLERALLLGGAVFAAGFAVDFVIAWRWARAGFPSLDAVRPAVLATLLMALGAQGIAGAFLLSMLAVPRAETGPGSGGAAAG